MTIAIVNRRWFDDDARKCLGVASEHKEALQAGSR
jgi:hypothetical protein